MRERNEPLVQRCIELAGRVAAPVVGTLAIELIMRGLKGWNVIGQRLPSVLSLKRFQPRRASFAALS